MRKFMMRNKVQAFINIGFASWVMFGMMLGFIVRVESIAGNVAVAYLLSVLGCVLFLFAYNVWLSNALYREHLKQGSH